jgi:hypothetical protein
VIRRFPIAVSFAAALGLAAAALGADTPPLPALKQVPTGAPRLKRNASLTKFSFIVAGDNRPAHRGDPLTQPLLDIVKKLRAKPPAFIVWDGDTVFGKGTSGLEKQYTAFLTAMGRTRVPFFNAPGNHEMVVQTNIPCGSTGSYNAELPDYSGAMQSTYQKRMGAPYGVFRYGNAAFLVLNTDDVPDLPIPVACAYNGMVSLAQLDALEETLDQLGADPTVTHIFLFMHRPVRDDNYSQLSASSNPESSYAQRLKAFDAVIDSADHPKVAFVFASHDHRLYIDPANASLTQTVPVSGAPTFIVTGGAGAPLDGCPANPPPGPPGSYYHTMLVTVDGPTVTVTVQPLYGTVPCTGPPS